MTTAAQGGAGHQIAALPAADPRATRQMSQREQRRAQEQLAKQQAQALADRAAAAQIAKDETTAEKNRAQAQRERVGAKGDAINVGAQVAAAIPLAPVADRLLSDKGPDDPQAQPGAVPARACPSAAPQ